MKKCLLLIVILVFVVYTGHAIIRTVSNVPSTLAQFNTIQAAVDASVSGDTIYVHGSPNQYAAFTIADKQLVVIGPGWSPNKNLPFITLVNGCTINGAASSNTEIQGLVLNGSVVLNTNHPDNMRFIRNHFTQSQSIFIQQSSTTYSGYLFEGNLFDNAQLLATSSSTYQNFLFQNNYFYESACCIDGNIHGFVNSVNVLFNHNLWFGPTSGIRNSFNSNCRFLTLTNNIFVRRNAASNNSSSTFNNNITFYPAGSTPPADPWTLNGNVNSGGNVSNQDPQMTAQTSVNSGTNNPVLDFTIAAGPANSSGSDGKDMGLLFDVIGSLNWTTSRNSRLPYVFSMNIINPTIPQGGTLNVQVEARKNN
ncbi:MAG: hypothetical protein JNK14_20410 [Chitinophagaceae bacterium]|nr:hypothetical protein [Chitinophagaceae bacterium]